MDVFDRIGKNGRQFGSETVTSSEKDYSYDHGKPFCRKKLLH